jgi:hypothetical protein
MKIEQHDEYRKRECERREMMTSRCDARSNSGNPETASARTPVIIKHAKQFPMRRKRKKKSNAA